MGRVLAEPLVSRERFPQFDNSGVDGYAVGCEADACGGARLRLVGASHAGAPRTAKLAQGDAVRVLTGAMVPEGAYGVAMQEDVVLDGGDVILTEAVGEGRHIRRAGDDFVEGASLLEAGSVVGPGALALLAAQGVAEVAVWARPAACVLVTGDELVDADSTPPLGGVRDSNGPMLEALIERDGCILAASARVPDTAERTRRALAEAAARSDIVVCAGGASVGDRDFVPGAVAELGEVHFHRVAIRPGKPVLMGTIGRCVVFALPGNPASAFVTYTLFVRECIFRLAGRADSEPRWVSLPHRSAHAESDRDDFVRSRFVSADMDEGTEAVFEQGSFGVRSLATADALVRFAANEAHKPGRTCRTLPLS